MTSRVLFPVASDSRALPTHRVASDICVALIAPPCRSTSIRASYRFSASAIVTRTCHSIARVTFATVRSPTAWPRSLMSFACAPYPSVVRPPSSDQTNAAASALGVITVPTTCPSPLMADGAPVPISTMPVLADQKNACT